MRTFTSVFLIFTLLSCKEDEPENPTTYSYLNPTLKTEYSFHEGSYWVYQDQDMNMDSIVLVNYETGFTSSCPGNCPKNEFILLHFENITRGISFNHYLYRDFIRYNGGGEWGQLGQPIFILDRDEGHEFNGLIVGENLDSLIVLDETFYDVKRMRVDADNQYQNEFDYDMDMYFTPAIGIVKYTAYDTQSGTKTWDLKNYSIE